MTHEVIIDGVEYAPKKFVPVGKPYSDPTSFGAEEARSAIAKVHRLQTFTAGDMQLVPDDLLEANKGDFEQVLIIGEREDGTFEVASTRGFEWAFYALAMAQNHVLKIREEDLEE